MEVTSAANQQSMRAKVEGNDATWVVTRQQQQVFAGNGFVQNNFGPTVTLQRIDPGVKDDDEIWATYLTANNRFLTLTGQRVNGQITYSQAHTGANVNVTEWAAGPNGVRMDNVFTARAHNVQQLRAEHPEEFRKYVLPLLSKVSDLEWLRPGAADVYDVFSQIPADQQVAQKVAALLPELDSPAYPVRDAASQKLEALGQAGVLAALRIDPAGLTDEQRGRLGQFVAKYRRRDFTDPAAVRKDANFLVDALEYDDPAVRAAARQALEPVLGGPVNFDVTLKGAALSGAADDVRKQIAQLAQLAPRDAARHPPDRGAGRRRRREVIVESPFSETPARPRRAVRPLAPMIHRGAAGVAEKITGDRGEPDLAPVPHSSEQTRVACLTRVTLPPSSPGPVFGVSGVGRALPKRTIRPGKGGIASNRGGAASRRASRSRHASAYLGRLALRFKPDVSEDGPPTGWAWVSSWPAAVVGRWRPRGCRIGPSRS